MLCTPRWTEQDEGRNRCMTMEPDAVPFNLLLVGRIFHHPSQTMARFTVHVGPGSRGVHP